VQGEPIARRSLANAEVQSEPEDQEEEPGDEGWIVEPVTQARKVEPQKRKVWVWIRYPPNCSTAEEVDEETTPEQLMDIARREFRLGKMMLNISERTGRMRVHEGAVYIVEEKIPAKQNGPITRRTLANPEVQTKERTMKAAPKVWQVTTVKTLKTRPRFETPEEQRRETSVTRETREELVTPMVQATTEISDHGATRTIQDELHVRFEGYTYCLERNCRWRIEREGWVVNEYDERSEVGVEGSRLRIIYRGTSYWLREDGHWGLGPLE
jgi:hypothetical protein